MFEVKMILDSVSPAGVRLTTLTATYPRFIHAEIMTHRDRARNAASSRAIPFPVMMERVLDEPVVPIMWPAEQRGMQGGEPLPDFLANFAQEIWLAARVRAVQYADDLHHIGRTFAHQYPEHPRAEEVKDLRVHKSIPNRLVEPWMWITVLMTATEWKNFFRLRCHPDAEPHFQKIAGMIRDAMEDSTPSEPSPARGGWHLPFISGDDVDDYKLEACGRLSVARCARVSYLTHDGKRDPNKDFELYDRLVAGSGFGHWSPHEHVAQVADDATHRSGPFRGWVQFRKFFVGQENVEG